MISVLACRQDHKAGWESVEVSEGRCGAVLLMKGASLGMPDEAADFVLAHSASGALELNKPWKAF